VNKIKDIVIIDNDKDPKIDIGISNKTLEKIARHSRNRMKLVRKIILERNTNELAVTVREKLYTRAYRRRGMKKNEHNTLINRTRTI
jgi:predicted RNase H-like nuclease